MKGRTVQHPIHLVQARLGLASVRMMGYDFYWPQALCRSASLSNMKVIDKIMDRATGGYIRQSYNSMAYLRHYSSEDALS